MGFLSKIKKLAPIAGTIAGSYFGPVGAAAGGAIGSAIAGGGSKASKKAGSTQSRYLQQGIGELGSAYTDQKNLLSGQQTLGNNALNQYAGLLGVNTGANGGTPDYSAFYNNPGYQFQQQQGEEALGRTQSARGNLFSGGAGKELQQFNNGLANQSYGDYMNRLGSFAEMGPQTNSLLAGYRGELGSGRANLLSGIGDARAGAYINSANSRANTTSNLLNFASSLYGGGGSGGSLFGGGGGTSSVGNQFDYGNLMKGGYDFSSGKFGF